MAGAAPPGAQRVLTLTPAHLLRVGSGLEAFRLQARGTGLVFSSLGVFRVRGSLDALLYRRLRSGRCRALFVGLSGLAWASAELPPAAPTATPAVAELRPPAMPALKPLPALAVQLTVTPPAPP